MVIIITMKIDKLEKLKFTKSNAEFEDGKELFMGFLKGKFTRNDIQNKMDEIAKKLRDNSKNAYLGVSVHYKEPNGWLPAINRSVNQPQVLFNPTDSVTTAGFKDIDGIYFYVTQMPEGSELKHKMRKVKKADTESMFVKK